MKRGKEAARSQFEQQKYDLNGWRQDEDNLEYGNSLLKILEKKITFPALEHMQKRKKTERDHWPALSIVPEVKTKANFRQKTLQTESAITDIKIKHLLTQGSHKQPHSKQTLKKKSPRAVVLQNFENIRTETRKDRKTQFSGQQHKVGAHYFEKCKPEKYFFQTIDLKKRLQSHKKAEQIWKVKHKKMTSAEAVPLKVAVFDESNAAINTKSSKKIRWDRLSLSQEKFNKTKHAFKPESSQEKLINNKSCNKRIKTKRSKHESLVRMIWMERLIHQDKMQSPERPLFKTEPRDFMDEHLQFLNSHKN